MIASSNTSDAASQRPDSVVITGIGMITSVGGEREAVWRAVRAGRSGVRNLQGLMGIPAGLLQGAPADVAPEYPGQLKVISLTQHATREALGDAGVDLSSLDLANFGCALSAHMGDTAYVNEKLHKEELLGAYARPWCEQFFPLTACTSVAQRYGLGGPLLAHSTACASGMIDILGAVRAIQDGQCDIALAGGAEAFHPVFAAGFYQMRVLAHHDDPTQACRPFDRNRQGFVMGEGAAVFVLERESHARARGAVPYAEIAGGAMLAEAHHVTGLDAESDALAHLIDRALSRAKVRPAEIGHINAHGTGTQQNDLVEARGIHKAFGPAASDVLVSGTKSMLGHLVNASGSVELALATLALRDQFAPPTLNLTDPDPECDLNVVPPSGHSLNTEHALKLSIAFGGHLAAIVLRRLPEGRERQS
ncbi:MAG: beta-ketoacyl-[acyl-carrier-protein] synthase family protein [Pirellulales bacterium]